MQLEHGLERDDDRKIGRPVRGTGQHRSHATRTTTILIARGLRLPSVFDATWFSRVPRLVNNRCEHPTSPVTFQDRDGVKRAKRNRLI